MEQVDKSAAIHFSIAFKKYESERRKGRQVRVEHAALMNAFIEYSGLNADFQEFVNQVACDINI